MLPRSQRLRSNRDFKRTYARGRSYVHPLLVLYVAPCPGGPARIGFSISKKLGGAVKRNRIKRRLREVCRARVHLLKPGYCAAFVARVRLADAPFDTVQAAVQELLGRAKLLQWAGGPEVASCGESALP